MALILLNDFIIAHVIQWRVVGKTVSPIEPSETMYMLQKGFIKTAGDRHLFSLAILAKTAPIFGRYICGWGCHILGSRISVDGSKEDGTSSESVSVAVVSLRAAYWRAGLFVWPVVYRMSGTARAGHSQITNHLVTTNFWQTFPSVAVAIPFLSSAAL